MKTNELKIPQFLLAELPIKDKSVNDDRLWINATEWLSLIEAYCEEYVDFVFPADLVQKRYEYVNADGIMENWVLVFVQNNVGFVDDKKDPLELLDDAWHWFELYLTWEDINLDFE